MAQITVLTESSVDQAPKVPKWLRLLGTSTEGGRDYAAAVEGELPKALRGSLYRNGPGLFERGGHRLRHVLDGDGIIQRLTFSDAGVRYQNAFVRTEKLEAEESAGRRLQATWTTRRSNRPFASIGGDIKHSQAGITIDPVHGKLIARDEVGPSYEIDPETLMTMGTVPVDAALDRVAFKAHNKTDPHTREWIMAGAQYGRVMRIHAAIFEPEFRLIRQFEFESPRPAYFHDFMATERFLIFVLHPCYFSPFAFLAGLKSYVDSLSWRPEDGNLVLVVPRAGGRPRLFEAPSAYMWHALNAFEKGDEIVADFVGYDEPDHFIGPDALFATIMAGQLGRAQAPGKIRRYHINLATGALREEIIDHSNHEFPMIDARSAMRDQQAGYFACGGLGGVNSGLKRLDYRSGASAAFDFGPDVHVGEPVFAPASGNGVDAGWLIAQCLDGPRERSFFAVFDAASVDRGPIAKVWLEHAMPISFHGSWLPAR